MTKLSGLSCRKAWEMNFGKNQGCPAENEVSQAARKDQRQERAGDGDRKRGRWRRKKGPARRRC